MSSSAEEPQRERLSRRRVLLAALALVDRVGPDALTMRRLAEELGVAAMSLYHHVHSRDDLLDGLSELLVAEIVVPEGGDVPPGEALRRFAHGVRGVANAHPAAFQLVGMRPLRTPAALVPVEAALSALRRSGLPDDEAVHAYRALVSYARGFALAEIAGFTLESAPPTGALPPAPIDAFPSIRALSPWLDDAGARDPAFEFGLGALLAGIGAE